MNKLSALLLALAALIASATAETTRLPVRGGASLQPSAQYALTYGHRLSARGADTPIGAELVFDSDLPVVHLDAVGSAVFKRGAEDSIEVTAGSEALKAISEWPEKTVVALDAKDGSLVSFHFLRRAVIGDGVATLFTEPAPKGIVRSVRLQFWTGDHESSHLAKRATFSQPIKQNVDLSGQSWSSGSMNLTCTTCNINIDGAIYVDATLDLMTFSLKACVKVSGVATASMAITAGIASFNKKVATISFGQPIDLGSFSVGGIATVAPVMTVKGTVSGRGKTLWNAPIVVSAAFDANSNFAAGIALAGSGVSSCGTNTGSGNVTPRNFTMGQKRIPWTGNINADISAATGVDLTVSMMPKFSAQANPKFTAGFSAVPALSCLPKGVVKVSAFGGGALDVGMMGKPVTTVWKQSNTSLYNQCW